MPMLSIAIIRIEKSPNCSLEFGQSELCYDCPARRSCEKFYFRRRKDDEENYQF